MPPGVLFGQFWAPASECPKECFLSAFWRFLGLTMPKSTLWGTPRQVPKIAQKALRGALSGPGPKSTPVNGSRDRNSGDSKWATWGYFPWSKKMPKMISPARKPGNWNRQNLISEELKKAVAVSEEKIQQRSRRPRPIFQQPFSLPESAQTLAGIAFRAAGRSGKNFPAASKFAGKPFQQGISESHSLLDLTDYLSGIETKLRRSCRRDVSFQKPKREPDAHVRTVENTEQKTRCSRKSFGGSLSLPRPSFSCKRVKELEPQRLISIQAELPLTGQLHVKPSNRNDSESMSLSGP